MSHMQYNPPYLFITEPIHTNTTILIQAVCVAKPKFCVLSLCDWNETYFVA